MIIRKREELEAREAVDIQRLARKGAGSLVYVLIVLAIAFLAMAASITFHKSWDLSDTSANSLSPQSMTVLASLEEDVEIYPMLPKRRKMQREQFWDLLRKYRDASRHIQVEFIDPIRQPGRMAEVGVDARGQDLGRGLTLIKRTRMVDGSPVEYKQTFRGQEEQDVTNAILEVGRTRDRVVGFARGYGERDPESSASGGIELAVRALMDEYYTVVDVDLERDVPNSVTVMVLAGPVQTIPRSHLDRLQHWLDGGGRLLALQDPDSASNLNDLLRDWGLRISGDDLLDPRDNLNGSPIFIKADTYSDHPVVSHFNKRLPTAFARTSGVDHFETGEGLLYHQELVTAGQLAYTMSEDGRRQPGPYAVAAASWRSREEGDFEIETRLVAVGDSDFISNNYLAQNANRNFFLNTMAWLGREEELISLRRDPMAGQAISLRPAVRTEVFWIVLSPAILVLVVGVVVLSRRRGR
ncbi:MAG: GldG family protein [Acidobacteria bacterium]|uniref:GldG family protein n=1 Tax=Candidatus Polarisedimenticola svalbardensis TaxID=2886004 RepID=A0A8J6Y9X8_9BACT|nr:GldG family protein [Candidatus Polarisedimenticola svalbardensis]